MYVEQITVTDRNEIWVEKLAHLDKWLVWKPQKSVKCLQLTKLFSTFSAVETWLKA